MDGSAPVDVPTGKATVQAEMPEAETQCEGMDADRLVDGLRNADSAAYAQLRKQFGPRINKFIGRRLRGDEHLAEELMIETLVDAVRNIRHFSPRRSAFSAWVFGIARRHVLGELRRRGRRGPVPTSAQVPLHAMPEQSAKEDVADAATARVEAQRQVARLRHHLSPIEMEALVLHYMDELSVREIAQMLRRSERAIKSLLHRARQKARERLVNDER